MSTRVGLETTVQEAEILLYKSLDLVPFPPATLNGPRIEDRSFPTVENETAPAHSRRLRLGAVVAADGLDGVLPAAEGGGPPGVVAAGGEGLAAGGSSATAAAGRARGRRPGRPAGRRPARSIRPEGCAGGAGRAGRPGTGGTGRSGPCRRRRGGRSRGSGRSALMASIRSATWKATPSSVARARSATRGGAGQAEDRAPRLGLPVRGAQAGQGGDEQDARVRVGLAAQAVDLGRRADRLQAVAEPLHGRPGDEHAPLQRVLRRAVAERRRQGRDQPAGRRHGPSPGVGQQERAGAVGALGLTRRQAPLADERRLLVARDAGDRQAVGEVVEAAASGRTRRRSGGFRAIIAAGTSKKSQRSSAQSQRAEVHQQGAGGVGHVGDVPRAAGQVPDQEAVDGPGGQLAGLGPLPGAGDVVEQPGDLGGREVRVEHQAGPLGDPGAAVAVPLAEVGRPAVLPDDRRADRLAGLPVPDDRRLALIGQADGRDPIGPECPPRPAPG